MQTPDPHIQDFRVDRPEPSQTRLRAGEPREAADIDPADPPPSTDLTGPGGDPAEGKP